MRKLFLVLWIFIVFSINSMGQSKSENESLIDFNEIRLEFSGQIENGVDSVFNVVAYLTKEDLDNIDKIQIKRASKSENITLTSILPKERLKKAKKLEKQKVILGQHSSRDPYLGVTFFDKKGEKISK